MKASVLSADKALSQHSQFRRSVNIIAPYDLEIVAPRVRNIPKLVDDRLEPGETGTAVGDFVCGVL